MLVEFWIPALGLLLAVALVLLRALRQPPPADTSRDADQRVYRDQLAEVERDIAKGSVAPEDGARLRAEVARRLLDADRAAQLPVPPVSSRSAPAVAVVLILLGAGFASYFHWLGAPGYPDLPLSQRLARATEFYNARPSQDAAEARIGPQGSLPTDPAEADLLQQLRAAVATRPDDLRGHQLLAKSEADIGNLSGARLALQRAVAILGDRATPQDHVQLAELMIAAAGGIVTPQAEAELVRTLTADPTNGVARYYSGLMLAQIGRPDQAFALWRPLLEESPPTAPWYAAIRDQIEALAQAAGVIYTPPDPKGPDAAAVAEAAEMTPEDRQAMITTMVTGLEGRLLTEGGPAQDWARLITALAVLGEDARLATALAAGQKALADDPAGLAALTAAAKSPAAGAATTDVAP